LIAAIAIFLFFQLQEEIMVLARLNIVEGIVRSGEIILWASVLAALSLIFIAAVDIPFQLWSHNKKLRMTKQEVKDESKETDGRPEVKAKIRQLQMQAAQRRMLEDVPKADVVITNPTHFSVALKYDTSRSSAPVVVAKGYDLMALKIRSIAADNGVPLYEEPPLARALYASTELGEEIPAPLFLAVARVLAYVFQLTRSAPTDYVPRPISTPLPEDFSKYNEEAS
jgi:flagellar biosynthetic protein FlhB